MCIAQDTCLCNLTVSNTLRFVFLGCLFPLILGVMSFSLCYPKIECILRYCQPGFSGDKLYGKYMMRAEDSTVTLLSFLSLCERKSLLVLVHSEVASREKQLGNKVFHAKNTN